MRTSELITGINPDELSAPLGLIVGGGLIALCIYLEWTDRR